MMMPLKCVCVGVDDTDRQTPNVQLGASQTVKYQLKSLLFRITSCFTVVSGGIHMFKPLVRNVSVLFQRKLEP